MLTRSLSIVATSLLVVAATGTSSLAATVICPSGYVSSGSYCVLRVTSADSGSGLSQGGGASGARVCTTASGSVVPCNSGSGVWSNANSCYMQLVVPPPPFSDPEWGGQQEGQIYRCTPIAGGLSYQVWVPPGVAPVVVDPRAIAEQLLAEMPLEPIEIGIVPEPGPDSMGLVGLPTWMWVSDPGPSTWGPQTRSLTVGGVTVTLQAKVHAIRWVMGDGAVVTCSTPGTPYEDRFGSSDSPTCGHRYTKQGTYAVEASTQWAAEWFASTGESGDFAWEMGSTTTINVGEAQALNQ